VRYPVGFLIRRWWWRKWHPAVRIGWVLTRYNTSGSATQTSLGIGLVLAGLILRSRRSLRLYSTTLDAGGELRLKVISARPTEVV